MLAAISKKITSYFIRKNIINEDEREVYNYCFEIMLSTLMNLVVLIIIGVATKKYLETLIFCISFVMLRGSVGGYHAKRHITCLLSIVIIYFAVMAMLYIPMFVLQYFSIAVLMTGIAIFAFLAPTDTQNKRLSVAEKSKLRKKTYVIILIFLIACAVFALFEKTTIYAYCICGVVFSVSMLVVAGRLDNIVQKKQCRQ
ncbi:MAG: accessory gene regulator B family protein [Clostridia bacterium]